MPSSTSGTTKILLHGTAIRLANGAHHDTSPNSKAVSGASARVMMRWLRQARPSAEKCSRCAANATSTATALNDNHRPVPSRHKGSHATSATRLASKVSQLSARRPRKAASAAKHTITAARTDGTPAPATKV